MNPFYTTTQVPKLKMLPKYGYALVEEELSKRELDDEILSKENEILQQLMNDDAIHKVNSPTAKRKLHMHDGDGIEIDLNANYMDANNNNSPSAASVKQRNKSALNVDDVELPSISPCPGLATSAVTYKLDWSSWRFLRT